MPKRQYPIDFDTVIKLSRDLGDIEESTEPGASFIKVHGKLLAFIPTHKSAELGSLAVRIDLDRRAELVSAAPDIYYVPDHYQNYPTLLVRLSRIDPDALKDLLRMLWQFDTRKPNRRRGPAQ